MYRKIFFNISRFTLAVLMDWEGMSLVCSRTILDNLNQLNEKKKPFRFIIPFLCLQFLTIRMYAEAEVMRSTSFRKLKDIFLLHLISDLFYYSFKMSLKALIYELAMLLMHAIDFSIQKGSSTSQKWRSLYTFE